MRAYEYLAEVLDDGHLSIPEAIKTKLTHESKIRVMLFLNDDETVWNDFAMNQFMSGYSEKDAIYDSL